jgi:hypothetical protein
MNGPQPPGASVAYGDQHCNPNDAPAAHAARQPLPRPKIDASLPAPGADQGAHAEWRGQLEAQVLQARHGYGASRLPAPAPVGRFVTIGVGLDARERAGHNLRRAIACTAAEYLRRTAAYLSHPCGMDVLVLGAARTAEVIDALDEGARRLGATLPEEVVASADRLREWARTLKQRPGTAGAAGDPDAPSAKRLMEWP